MTDLAATLLDLCATLEATPMAVEIAQSKWLFPTIETLHVLALVIVFGSIAFLDLRLLGLSRPDRAAAQVAADLLPWTWGGFALAALSGALMFASAATRYFDNVPFRIKMALLALAGLNMVVLHFGAWRQVGRWGTVVPSPAPVRTAAALSLLFWISIVFAGRWIGFT
jgi:hypothetical protein